jgi:hypothetical protein
MFKIKTRVKILTSVSKGCGRYSDSNCGIGARSGS